MKKRNLIRLMAGTLIFILPLLSAFMNIGSTSEKLYRIKVKNPLQLQKLISYTGKCLPLVSAHRGGSSQNYPENCLETFEHTLKHTYAFIECDPRYTKDSAIVLHHDPGLRRTTNGEGIVNNFTLEELRKLKLKDLSGNLTNYIIPTLDEAIDWAKGKAVLVLDQKDVPPAILIKKAEEQNALGNVILIVYSFKDAETCYKLNKNVVMEIMIPNIDKAIEFEKTGVPWKNIIAFVGHNPPNDQQLYNYLHQKGIWCMAGSSRNVDRKFLTNAVPDIGALKTEYQAFYNIGIDIIESDIPRELSILLFKDQKVKNKLLKYK